MANYFLGIDIGATKSHALVVNEVGEAVGFGESGPGNWESVGWEQTRKVFHEITSEALAEGKINKDQISGSGFGIAGYDWPEDHEPHLEIVDSLKISGPTILSNDAIIGLMAGSKKGWGVVISAGTGNNCRGRDKNGVEGRITGDGEMFAEYGGASQIVRKAVQSISLNWSFRGPKTRLTETFIKITGALDTTDLIAGLIRGRYHLSADHAPMVFALAESGDLVAQEIIQWAGRELGSLAIGVAKQLNFEHDEFEVVLTGSVFKGGVSLINPLKETVHAVAPAACFVRLHEPPVVGGVLLGMECAGINIAKIRERVLLSTVNFINDSKPA